MRILLLTHHYEPEIGAPQRRWTALVRAWRAAGHEVTVIAPLPHYPLPAATAHLREGMIPWRAQPGRHGEHVVRVPYFPHGYGTVGRSVDHAVVAAATAAAGLLRRLRGWRAEVVIATVPALPTLLSGRLLSIAHRAPLVVEMRDAWPDLLTHTPGLRADDAPRQLLRRIVHRAVSYWQRGADIVVTTSASFAQVLARRGVRTTHVIRNGADLSDTPNLGPAVRARRELRILYAGTLGRSQGLGTAVEAAHRVARAGVPVRLRLIGDGARRGDLHRLAEDGPADVELLSPVPRGRILEHYRWADTLLVSLRDWKPLEWTIPSKLYEALATDRHVSGVLAGEAAAVLADADGGFVVAPGDAAGLAERWLELAGREEIIGGGRGWVADHAEYANLATRYLETLDLAVHRGRRGVRRQWAARRLEARRAAWKTGRRAES